MKTIKIKKGYRSFAIDESREIDEDKRTVKISFSSELPVKRWFGKEILDHSKKSADLSRLNNSGAVLIDHWSDQVGVVEKAWIEDKRGFAIIRFSKSTRGTEVFEDIKDGIRKNVSFGYMINSIDFEKEENEERLYRSYDWTPYEISIVSVPADQTVGVGRDADTEQEIEVKGEKEEEKPLRVHYNETDAKILKSKLA